MPRPDVEVHFSKIDELSEEMNSIVPPNGYRNIQFRSDLAGLLIVAIAATYETCVKEILQERAAQHHPAFGGFAQRNFEKLNSKIQVSDLTKYCKVYDPSINVKFKTLLAKRKEKILERTGINIESSYQQVLNWRHDYAHARIRHTTIEEAVKTHMYAKRVIYVFSEAFYQLE